MAATKADNPNSIPGAYMVGGENDSFKFSSDLNTCPPNTCTSK